MATMQKRVKQVTVAVVAVAAAHWTTSALAFEVSEKMLNEFVQTKLAEKKFSDLHLASPKVTLLDGYATFCTGARPKIYPKDINFCSNLTPKWRQETGSLLATKMSLVSLNVPGVDVQQIELVKTILNQGILPGLEGVEIYRSDNAIGKQISCVKVMPGKLDLSLW